MIIPPLPEAEPNSRSRKRLCRRRWVGSLGSKVQLREYSTLALPYLYQNERKKTLSEGITGHRRLP